MRVLVVVLTFNGMDDTEACLAALAQQTHPDAEVLVIDNGSRPEEGRRLRELAASGTFRTRWEPENLGFAGGVNVGIRLAQAEGFDAVALLNNDALPEPDWLARLVASLTESGAAICTGLLLRRSEDAALNGTIDTAGDQLSVWGMPFPRGRDEPRGSAPAAGAVFSASGGASLYRTELFDDIGGFDETFFAYFEDVDLGFRARLAGHDIHYEPSAVAHHRVGGTSGRMPGFTVRQTFANLPLLLLKNVPAGLRRRVWSRFAVLFTLMLAKSVLRGDARPALGGLVRGLRLCAGHGRRERRRIQRAARVSGAEIGELLWPDLPPQQHGMRALLRLFRR